MSNDLISRKAVIELIENCHVLEDAYCLVDYINELTVAYDVDKVVERLEEKTEIAYNRYMDCSPNTPPSVYARYGTQYNERKLCLEIVKSGGIE